MTQRQKKMLARIIASAAALAAVLFIPSEGIVRFALFMVPYLIAGYDVLLKAVKGVRNLQPFDEYFLMSVATVGGDCPCRIQRERRLHRGRRGNALLPGR